MLFCQERWPWPPERIEVVDEDQGHSVPIVSEGARAEVFHRTTGRGLAETLRHRLLAG
jgi:hypothetical protein